MSGATTALPVTLDVPYAAQLVGFRPASLPPLAPGEKGIQIGYIQSGQWAERSGLNVGDLITHVNGKAVAQMQNDAEFIRALKDRPLKITVELQVKPGDLTNVLQSFDWVSRLKGIEKVRAVKKDPKETNAMFERVFQAADPASPENSAKSNLFDFTNWMGTPGTPPPPVPKADLVPSSSAPSGLTLNPAPSPPPQAPVIQIQKVMAQDMNEVSPPPSPTMRKKKVKPPKPPPQPAPRLGTMKWVPTYPLTLWVKVEQGFKIPESAGTLGMDFLAQPFYSDPFVEISIVPSIASELTMDQILGARPVDPTALIQTPVCDAQQRWNYNSTITLSSKAFKPSNLLVIGKLMDYRRLEAAKIMGLFAIQLDTVEILDDVAKAKPKSISLSPFDPVAFNVAETKLKITMCLQGRYAMVSPSGRTTPDALEGRAFTQRQQLSESSESSESEYESETPVEFVQLPQPAQITVQQTPFQRAYMKAMSDIRAGDMSPVRMQQYTLR